MQGYDFDDEPIEEIDESAKFNEQSAHFLLHAYISLVKAFQLVKDMYFGGKINKADYHKVAYACFLKVCENEFGIEISQLKEIFKPEDF